MKCAKCGSERVSVQVINETQLKKKHSILYWMLIGWWLEPILWICLFVPMLIWKLFRPKSYKMVNKSLTKCVCQDCGHTWTVK